MKTREEYIQYYNNKGTQVESIPQIRMNYEGKNYLVDLIDAYDMSKDIELPNGTILRANGWLETYPPSPAVLTIVKSNNTTLAKEE